MAINLSKNQIEISRLNYYGLLYKYKSLRPFSIIYKKITVRVNNYYFKIRRILFKKKLIEINPYSEIPNPKINIEETDLIQINKFFIKNNYCFVENLFDDNFYQLLKKNFPPKEFFPAPDNPSKNYRFNFRCQNNSNEYDSKKIEHLDLFSTLKKFYDFIINSKNFQKFIDTLTLDTGYKNYSVVSTLAFKNSYLIPHKDTVANSDDIKNIVNVIYFVDGADCPEFSGGTGIYKDNEFNNPIFLPSNLKNSALIYDSKSDFYHGFKPMKKNMFRKAVTAQFIKDYK
jgi:hypothetical protein